jgi:hypothetical protein
MLPDAPSIVLQNCSWYRCDIPGAWLCQQVVLSTRAIHSLHDFAAGQFSTPVWQKTCEWQLTVQNNFIKWKRKMGNKLMGQRRKSRKRHHDERTQHLSSVCLSADPSLCLSGYPRYRQERRNWARKALGVGQARITADEHMSKPHAQQPPHPVVQERRLLCP